MGRRKNARPGSSKRVIGYIRVSTSDQQLGPEAQLAALQGWCESHSAELVAVHSDIGVSGGAELERRPGLMEAVDALVPQGAGVLLVAKRDRLARDTMLSAMIERMAQRNGAEVKSADGVGDGDGPESLLMRRMVDAFAEYERSVICARTRVALAVMKRQGLRVGSVPYGSKLAADGKALEPCEAEQKVLRVVVALRAKGLTYRAIATQLEAEGLVSRSGKRWHPQTVSRMVEAA